MISKFDYAVVDDHTVCTVSTGTSPLCTIIVLVLSLTVDNFNSMINAGYFLWAHRENDDQLILQSVAS